MHEKALPKGSKVLLNKIESSAGGLLDGWTLAGGTGLALQIGHRISVDFDFFRTDPFAMDKLHGQLKAIGDYEVLQEEKNTISVMAGGVKLSFFCIEDPFIFKSHPYHFFSVADINDIALMKLVAIAGRGSRKDFIDLYFILRMGESLKSFFNMLPKKYAKGRINSYHILKSLCFFDDAESEPMPRMLEPFDWDECKNFFLRYAQTIVLG